MAKSQIRAAEVNPLNLTLFGPPPLLEGEDSSAYDELHTRISGAVKPEDIFEGIWVRNAVDLTWEIFRWRRFKSQLIKANLHRGMATVLESLCPFNEARELTAGWASRDKEVVEKINELLSDADLSMDEVIAETTAIKISDIERFDRLIMNAEARFNTILREVDRYRANKGQALRRAIEDVEEARYVEIKPPQIKSEGARDQQT